MTFSPDIARPTALLAMSRASFEDLFDPPRLARLRSTVRLAQPARLEELGSEEAITRLHDIEILVTGWGTPRLGPDVIAAAPRLRAVVHAGGSVKGHVSQEFWDAGVLVTSAAEANAVPVAEFTVATILLEGKRAARYAEGYAQERTIDGRWRDRIAPTVNFGGTVGIVGLSRVGRRVAALLRQFDLEVLASDPLVDARQAALLGAELVDLDDLLRRSDIVTLHAPELPETRHLLDARRLSLLREGAVVVNTARGPLIDGEALVARCRAGVLRAILDVTDPEPLPPDSVLFTTPGVVLTPHIAGAMDAETHRLADAVLDELERIAQGRPPRHPVDRRSLEFIA
ncbi:hydroxyacid dehydrogenase [Microbacterium kyungheense]|uniref:Phosphoglycerate dehydrogenase-like enzyme n=1 Tax=Microbacterium kyungheense TaxID=1263636 RepID=A0A543EUK7_9MICO|nr:hydroxyacid dehydrogenase [Microbacterium kyungheense]TQM25256.1 phosphoglycerate dehydrogenase-like enzyme [Microbacterium kyungheense]